MILKQNPETGYWTLSQNEELLLVTHAPTDCFGPLCDVHNRRGPEPWASYPLNWRGDRAMMEVICPCGIGHPTIAQAQFWTAVYPLEAESLLVHGCCVDHCPMWGVS